MQSHGMKRCAGLIVINAAYLSFSWRYTRAAILPPQDKMPALLMCQNLTMFKTLFLSILLVPCIVGCTHVIQPSEVANAKFPPKPSYYEAHQKIEDYVHKNNPEDAFRLNCNRLIRKGWLRSSSLKKPEF